MLWAIRDYGEYYGPDVTIVRASSREEAVRLWMESDNDITLKKVDGGWLCKIDVPWLSGEEVEFKPLRTDSSYFQKLTKYTMLDDHLVQVVPLEVEGGSAVLLNRHSEIPDAEPPP